MARDVSKEVEARRNLSNLVEVGSDAATITARVRALAQQHVADAIRTLADIMLDGDAPASARRAAAVDMLAHAGAKPDSGKGDAPGLTINVQAMHLATLESLSAGAMGTVIDHEPR